jgi:HAD superfamily hydrolase (TIGR01450 family)
MIYENLESIYREYDSFFIDVYGVLYDGMKLYDGVLEILKKVKDSGKEIVILSNTTLVADICKTRFAEFGLIEGIHYDQFVSSGEAFRASIPEMFNNSAKYYQIFAKNTQIFDGSNLVEVTDLSEADFVYVGIPHKDGKRYTVDDLRTKSGVALKVEEVTKTSISQITGFDELTSILSECQKANKMLVISNPDVFAIDSVDNAKRSVLCQGGIGEFYEFMGGTVVYFGKPYAPIFDYAKTCVSSGKSVMIGDTPWTDIMGGTLAGMDSVLTLTGVTGQFLNGMSAALSVNAKLVDLFERITPHMAGSRLNDVSPYPTAIIKSLA